MNLPPESKNPNTPQLWDKLLFLWNDNLLSSPYYLDKLNKVCGFLKQYQGNFLDIGMGVGNLEKKILDSKLDLNLYGTDISSKAIEQVKKEIKGNFFVSNIYNMPFANNFFNVIAVLDVLEHIYKKDNKKSLKEISRILKKNGGLIISVPLNENLSKLNKTNTNHNKHVREYTFDIIKKELEAIGFFIKTKVFIIAFKKNYYLKSVFVRLIPNFRDPNLLIVHAIKK